MFNVICWGFVTGLRSAGLQKDQGNDVLDALELIVVKDSRRNSAAVRTLYRILHKHNNKISYLNTVLLTIIHRVLYINSN